MILIVAAMQDEIEKLIKNFTLVQEKPFELYKNKKAYIIRTGIGKANAASATTYALSTLKDINKVINVGFAGATKEFNVSDIVYIEKALYHDVDVTMFGYEKGQIPGNPAFYVSKSDKEMFKKFGTLFTGDCFMSNKELSEITRGLFDMEGAAIYQVCHIFNKDLISIKVVSDIINSDNQLDNYKKFEENEGKLIIKEAIDKFLEV